MKNNEKNLKQTGGAERTIPQYVEQKFNPAIPNEQKKIMANRYEEQQNVMSKNKTQGQGQGQEKQILNLQVYQPQKPKPERPMDGLPVYPTVTTNPYFPAQMAQMINPYASSMLGQMYPMAVNVNKIYEINTNGPVDQHSRLHMIFEDLLPDKPIKTTFKTIKERITQIQYVRTILFHDGDGCEVNLDGNSGNSLLSHIKFMELNPFNTNKLTPNPYKGLPYGFLIYRSCYPIKRGDPFGQLECSRDSMALNIRIYKLNAGGYLINKQNTKKFYEYEQWREIAYYEYIREHIIKKKICPHFVTLYGYYLCKNSRIEFNKIMEMSTEKIKSQGPFRNSIQDLNIYEKKENEFVEAVVRGLRQVHPGHIIQKLDSDLTNVQPVQKPVNLDDYTGEVIVSITESPTYSLYTWASKIYQQQGNTKTMINRGFHDEYVWKSIIFQIMVSLFVMKLHNIYIDNFSIENNVFIKDLNVEGTVVNYWKYRIKGIDYYIPNYGYLVLIDSNYSDINTIPDSTLAPSDKKNKLDGHIFKEGNTLGTDDNVFITMFKEGIDPDNFGKSFTMEGGTPPDQTILELMSKLYTTSYSNIEDYFTNHMSKFMNNRIGTYLKEQEIIHIRNDDLREFKKGQIIVHEEGTGIYRFVLYLDTTNGVAKILTKDKTSQNDHDYVDTDVEIIEKQIQITTLKNYSLTEPIVQNFKPTESNLSEENILETYNIV